MEPPQTSERPDPEATRADTGAGRGSALIALGSAAVLVAAVLWDLVFDVEHGSSMCPLRALTGVECPSCGLTRSFVALGNLSWADAVAAHPLGPALAALLAFELGRHALAAARGRAAARSRAVERAWVALALALLILGVGRWVC